MEHKVIDTSDVVIRFAGDSGDGMQLTGTLFANMSAVYGNGLATFPDYPAEIRAPKGTVAGVSGFQVHIGSHKVNTPGDFCDMLVAMNPAALKANAKWLKRNATVLVNADAFDEVGMNKAGFSGNPFEELHIEDRNIICAPITKLTEESLKDSGLDNVALHKCKNMFTLGMACFIYSRPLEYIYDYIEKKFSRKHPEMIAPNRKVVFDGYNYAANIQAVADTYRVAPARLDAGTYRNITGNQAAAWGLIAAAEKAGLPLFCGSYPITPATSILEELAIHKNLNVKTMQTEDEIAGICCAVGAAFAGNLAVTTTSGPGLSLKSEALGLAVMTELPLVVIDVQRAGPCTGMPTKTEQADLNEALYGRNGESPMVVIAAHSPAHCFDTAFMAAKIALERMVPVLMLFFTWKKPLGHALKKIGMTTAAAMVLYFPVYALVDMLRWRWLDWGSMNVGDLVSYWMGDAAQAAMWLFPCLWELALVLTARWVVERVRRRIRQAEYEAVIRPRE